MFDKIPSAQQLRNRIKPKPDYVQVYVKLVTTKFIKITKEEPALTTCILLDYIDLDKFEKELRKVFEPLGYDIKIDIHPGSLSGIYIRCEIIVK